MLEDMIQGRGPIAPFAVSRPSGIRDGLQVYAHYLCFGTRKWANRTYTGLFGALGFMSLQARNSGRPVMSLRAWSPCTPYDLVQQLLRGGQGTEYVVMSSGQSRF